VLPDVYPGKPPLVWLDEPENKDVIDFVDYLDHGNQINFDYLIFWDKEFSQTAQVQRYNLINALAKIYNLFLQVPPVSIEELFPPSAFE